MNGTASTASVAASKLGDLLATLALNNQWDDIELTAQSLANDLRVTDVDQQTALGKTLLPSTLTNLLKGAIDGAPIPAAPQKQAVVELLRAGANLCRDHDDNRSNLLEAGFPQQVVALLEGYAESVVPNESEPLPLSTPDLKIVKTAIGVLLNISFGYEPVKTRLISLEAAFTILKLSIAIYPPGCWLRPQKPVINGEPVEATGVDAEVWSLRTGLSQWAWRTISEFGEDEDGNSRCLFTPDALPYLVRSLHTFTPPYPTLPTSLSPELIQTLIQVDFDTLEECAGLVESLSMDVEDVRLSLARGLAFPAEHGGVACLSDMLTFVDKGNYPPYWAENPDERAAREKGLDRCKAAVIKSTVELAGEEKNIDVLWDDSDPEKPGGEFVFKMVQWIRQHKSLQETNRDDLIICATLSLGNLVRRDAHAAAIVNPPVALMPDLATLLEPETDIKVKHGVIGLLKHLSQTQSNRTILGNAGIMQKLATCQIWSEKADVVEIVQVAAIGVAKHMCNSNAENAIALVLPGPDQPPSSTALAQILSLVRRSDSVAIKSEGTRVLVNAVKSLWSSDASSNDPAWPERRKEATAQLVTPVCAAALAQLIGRSRKYPILINEGVVALSLLSTHTSGGLVVLDALLNPLPTETPPHGGPLSQPISAGPSTDSPAIGMPRRALDMLVSSLRNADGRTPVEVRGNICALLGRLGRQGVVPESRVHDVGAMKLSTKEWVEEAAGEEGPIGGAARKTLEAWA
ncbi:hypothetical protein EW026_g4259 [Hermanssonia centrifuga]|uniref:ARM repeat-containing protein n=1 Tax=Hermanssonia centrifuga TaxID=98765 RepID=A0A4S4KHQ2_9APHY|nr:hypothetical protein EW026_g4259 [Hermanssonia centrifuga]